MLFATNCLKARTKAKRVGQAMAIEQAKANFPIVIVPGFYTIWIIL